MNILLICPCDKTNLFSSLGMAETEEGELYTLMPNIALPTLAALSPPDVHVTIVDEALQTIDFSRKWDLVGITSYVNHRKRVFELADEFRARGQLVAIGGPFASVAEEEVRPHCDVLFVGEAEETWPRFLEEFRRGEHADVYRATRGSVDVAASPTPAFEKLLPRGYQVGLVQTSRGCPFSCEFCDVPVYVGRVQRHKTPSQLVAELEKWYELGYRTIYLGDDNFTVHRRKCSELLKAMSDWNAGKGRRVTFMTQVSIDISRNDEMLELCRQSGLIEVFVGIESADVASLQEAKKKQNLKRDLAEDVRRFFHHGISVQAGLILGFDADTLDSPRMLYEFAQRSNILAFSLNLLMAPPGTELYKRIAAEGRLRPWDQAKDFDTNIEPKRYPVDLQRLGARWFVNRMYQPADFLGRLVRMANDLPVETPVEYELADALRQKQHWEVLFDQFARLGPEFVHMMRTGRRAFRGKRQEILLLNLHSYVQAVTRMQRHGMWDPDLAAKESPYTSADWEAFHARGGSSRSTMRLPVLSQSSAN